MRAFELIEAIHARGFELRLDAGKVVVKGRRRLDADLAAELRAQREDVLSALAASQAAPSPVLAPGRIVQPASPCRLCGRTRLWRLPEVAAWWCAACLPCALPAAEVVWADAMEVAYE